MSKIILILMTILLSGLFLTGGVEKVLAKSANAKTKAAVKVKKANSESKKATKSLTDKLIQVAKLAGAKPDEIEMTRYAIKHPLYFSQIVEHAVANDYVFFGLVGAVKVARKTSSKFTQPTCNLPYLLVNNVFDKANQTIDDAKGKEDTNAVAGLAKEYAANYAKEQSNSAKEEVLKQLSENVPYFADIPLICSFAFETEFELEKNLFKIITEKVKKLNYVYNRLQNGDVIAAVETMIDLGATSQIACDFIDSSVSGGLIGRTPVLGNLAKGLCSNFAGKVIDGAKGIVKGGIGYAEDGVEALADLGNDVGCKIYSLIGNGCSSAPPDLATQAVNAAKSWCASRGGLDSFVSKVPGQDASFMCVDKSVCQQKPGKPMRCVTAQEKMAWDNQRKKLLANDLQKALPADGTALFTKWSSQCPQKEFQCQNEIVAAIDEAVKNIKTAAAANPTNAYVFLKLNPFQQAENKARLAVHEAEFRVLPKKWAQDFEENWQTRCKGSKTCIEKTNFIKKLTLLNVSTRHKQKPADSHSTMGTIYADGEKSAYVYFINEFQADKKDDDAERKQIIRMALMNAIGREANLIELSSYSIRLKKGEIDAAAVYADAVKEMNKYPQSRTEMINRGYLAVMGRAANPTELQYWQKRNDSYKDFVQAARDFLYSPAGAKDLRETVIRAYQIKFKNSAVVESRLAKLTADFSKSKLIYAEMIKN